jgi:tetratricopeptide (TPR) repeat protein
MLGVASVAIAMARLVIVPWLAHQACSRADQTLADNSATALADYEQAVRLDPHWDVYWSKLAGARQWAALRTTDRAERQALLQAAEAAWERLVQQNPLCGAHHDNRGRCLALLCQEGLCQPHAVFAAFEKALSHDPSNPLFHADAADAALRLGDRDKAWDFASAGVKDQFQCGPLYGQIGYLFLQRHVLDEAVRYLEEALAGFWDGHEDWRQAAQANLIVAYHHAHEYQKLERLASHFLEARPDMPVIRALLADAREKLGRVVNSSQRP